LKEPVSEVREFIAALHRAADGGSALDPVGFLYGFVGSLISKEPHPASATTSCPYGRLPEQEPRRQWFTKST
jgi:hypothetical protein